MILDTNALSGWAENDARLLAKLPPPMNLSVPIVVVGEYLSGLVRSRIRVSLESWLTEVLRMSSLLTLTLESAHQYAEIRELLRRGGRPIPVNDIWIAALAFEHGLPILSRDAHFDYIEGIERISW